MKISSRPAPVPTFKPIEVTVVIEHLSEMLALKALCESSCGSTSPRNLIPPHHVKQVERFLDELLPYVTPL